MIIFQENERPSIALMLGSGACTLLTYLVGVIMPDNTEFFIEQSEQSAVKAHIVSSYFAAWSRVMKHNWKDKLCYIDLFCGPGKYNNGALSAPLLVIESTLSDPDLSKRMLFAFNDEDSNNISSLMAEVAELDTDDKLKGHIEYHAYTVGSGFEDSLKIPSNYPVLSFVDPFGYKDLTINLIDKLISNNGSDCIFFFNYNRINMALSSNPKFDEHLNGIFGVEGTAKLKSDLKYLSPAKREPLVLKRLTEALTQNKANYVLPFKFYGVQQKRTSHFIVFVTKHPTACKIMKQIMYSNSAKDSDGIASFSFEDSNNFNHDLEQMRLFNPRMEELKSKLLCEYFGDTANVKSICDKYEWDFSNYYVGKNIKDALLKLEAEGRIQVLLNRKRVVRKGLLTMPDDAIIKF